MLNKSPITHTDDSPGLKSLVPEPLWVATVITDDERLLRSTFAENPEKGCELLFLRYYGNLCNHAIRFVYSKEIAEDLVSEVYAVFWQDRIFEEITTSFRAYLYKAVRHRSYNYLKWHLNRTASLESAHTAVLATTPTPDEALQYNELYQKIESIVQQLPPQCRRAYILKRVEGKKYGEIADELQISTKAVEALVSRALLKLRSELKDNWFLGIIGVMLTTWQSP